MAHKTLINGTAYNINGGLSMVEGTSYSVKNGKVLIDGTEYDINFLLPPGFFDLWSGNVAFDRSAPCSIITTIIYANGYWVVGGQFFDRNLSTGAYTISARIAYSTSLVGNWSIKDLWSSNNYSYAKNNKINDIAYDNGYWLVCGGSFNDDSRTNYGTIAYTNNLDDEWTITNIWGSGIDTVCCARCIEYANGYWVVGGTYNDDAVISYTSDITGGSGGWTRKTIWGNANSFIGCIKYANGYWVVGGRYYSRAYRAAIAYATSPEDSWTTRYPFGSTSISYNRVACITYIDNYWIIGGGRDDRSSTDGYCACIAYCANSTTFNDWTTVNIWGKDTDDNYINSVGFAHNTWLVGGQYVDNDGNAYAAIAYSVNIDGPWTTILLWSIPIIAYRRDDEPPVFPIMSVAYGNNMWVAGGFRDDSSTSYAHVSYAGNPEEFIVEVN